MPETPNTERPNKKAKHRAPNAIERQSPRFAFKPTDSTSLSVQQSSHEPHTVSVVAETPIRDTSAGQTASEPLNGPNLDTSLEDSSTSSATLPSRLKHLTSKYSFAQMTVKSGVKIEKKVRTLIEFMSRFSYLDPSIKPGIVALRADSASVNKLISVVEIAKREIEAIERGGKWWQYNELDSEVKEISRNQIKKNVKAKVGKQHLNGKGGRISNGADVGLAANVGRKSANLTTATEKMDLEDEDDGEVFETMPEPHDGSNASDTKLRNVPILTIYMSRVPVPEMKVEFRYIKGRNWKYSY